VSFLDNLIANTIRADVRAEKSYFVADASGYIKLDQMENPYVLPEDLRVQLGQRIADVLINRYPAPSYLEIKRLICEKLGVPAGYDVLLGNGSDEIISILAVACARQDRRATVLAPEPSFVMFRRSAQFAGMDYVGVALKEDFSLDLPAMLAAIEQHKPSLVFLAYPNNPTGNLFDEADIVRIIEAVGENGIVVVDEAYQPFAKTSFMDKLPQYPNLAVMRTLSKLGLAGIRLGYLSAAPALLEQFDKVRPPYNVNVLTQTAAEFALAHLDVLDAQAEAINEERTKMVQSLSALPGVTVFPSAANFLLVRVPDPDATTDKLRAERVLIKNLSKMHKLLSGCIRITVSTPEENSVVLNALKASLIP
jgi:histidinol-phosphate aminotransferase